jgi:predicted RecA/RadA family phage recombinase
MATFIQEGVYLDHTPEAALAQGDVVAIEDDFYGVATAAIAAGAKGALAVQGVFEFDSDGAIAAGALVFWDSDAKKVSATPADDCYIGRAVAAAASDKCRVALNASNIGEYTPIVPGSKPTATQATISAFTAANPAAITAKDPAAITAVDPAEMTAKDPTVVDPTTEGIVDSVAKTAIEANNTAIKAVEAEVEKLVDDATAIRAEVVKLVTDLTASRAEVVKLVTDLTATRAEVVKIVTDLGTVKTALNAGKTDLAAVVAQLESAGVLK